MQRIEELSLAQGWGTKAQPCREIWSVPVHAACSALKTALHENEHKGCDKGKVCTRYYLVAQPGPFHVQ